jgi:hypothetical protein
VRGGGAWAESGGEDIRRGRQGVDELVLGTRASVVVEEKGVVRITVNDIVKQRQTDASRA